MLTCAACGSAAHSTCASEWGRGCPSVGCRSALSRALPRRPALPRRRPASLAALLALAALGYALACAGVRCLASGSPLSGWALLIALLELSALGAARLEERERALR